MPCGAVLLCDAVRCCYSKCHHRCYCCTYRFYRLNDKKNAVTVQLSPAIAQQRSAVRCCTVPCLDLRCCAVLRCAFFRTYSSTRYHAIPGADRYVCTCVLVFFRLLHWIVLSQSSFCVFENFTHAGDQNVTSPTSTQKQSTGQSALRLKQLLALSSTSHNICGKKINKAAQSDTTGSV